MSLKNPILHASREGDLIRLQVTDFDCFFLLAVCYSIYNLNSTCFYHLSFQTLLENCPIEKMRMLISCPYSGTTPLAIACKNGHLKVAQYLIDHCNADVEQVLINDTQTH